MPNPNLYFDFRFKSLCRFFFGMTFGAFGFLFSIKTCFASSPQSFTYQGKLLDHSGLPLQQPVSIRLQIWNSASNCLLYEELQTNLNFSSTEGQFSLQVGSLVTSGKRTPQDPGLAMSVVFSNESKILRAVGSPNCISGYQPAFGDIRKLRVAIINTEGVDVLSPDQTISSVPFAQTAETLQGKQPGDFISNTLTGMQQAIEDLVNGKFLRVDSEDPSKLNASGKTLVNVGAPTSANDATNKSYVDSNFLGRGLSSSVASLANNQTLVWDSTANQWQAKTLSAASLVVPASCAADQASRWDGSTWSCLSVPAGGTAAGGFTAIDNVSHPSGEVRLTNSAAKVQAFNFPDGGKIILPDATTLFLGGPLFSFFNESSDPIPIFTESTGPSVLRFIGGLDKFTNLIDFFLLEKLDSHGKWRTSGALSPLGMEKAVLSSLSLSSNPETYRLIGKWIQLVPGSENWIFLASYKVAGAENLIAFKVDPVNLSVSFGSPLAIGGSEYIESIRGISPTTGILIRSGKVHALTINTTTLNLTETFNVSTAPCPSSTIYRGLSTTRFVCAYTSGSDVSLKAFDIGGSSFNPVVLHPPSNYVVTMAASSANQTAVGFRKLSGDYWMLLGYDSSSSRVDSYFAEINFGVNTAFYGTLPIASSSATISKDVLPETNLIAATTTEAHVFLNEAGKTVMQTISFNGPARTQSLGTKRNLFQTYNQESLIFYDSTNYPWILSHPTTSGLSFKYKIPNFTFSDYPSSSQASSCVQAGGLRISPDQCVSLDVFKQSSSDHELRIKFLRGY